MPQEFLEQLRLRSPAPLAEVPGIDAQTGNSAPGERLSVRWRLQRATSAEKLILAQRIVATMRVVGVGPDGSSGRVKYAGTGSRSFRSNRRTSSTYASSSSVAINSAETGRALSGRSPRSEYKCWRRLAGELMSTLRCAARIAKAEDGHEHIYMVGYLFRGSSHPGQGEMVHEGSISRPASTQTA